MEKCNVCGKTALLPERFNSINICKVCFLKVGGPLWKRNYDELEVLSKNRVRALEFAEKCNFPADVVFEINEFFSKQENTMQMCDCCGGHVQELHKLVEKQLCKKCHAKLNVANWIDAEFDDNEDVEMCRKETLKLAQKKQCPKEIVREINTFFNSKIQKDLICCINGGVGQKLKIYNDHCILITSNLCDIDNLSLQYNRSQKQFNFTESMEVLGTAASLLSGMLPGGLVRKGVRAAGSALTSSAKKASSQKAPAKVQSLTIIKGNYRIDYGVYTSVDFKKCGDGENDVGFIRFHKRYGTVGDVCVFFFRMNHKKAEKGYRSIREGIDEFLRKTSAPQQAPQPQPDSSYSAVIAELRELKIMLDDGILSQEEFDFMKKELLGMQSPNQ